MEYKRMFEQKVIRKDTVSYSLNNEIANEFEKHLRISEIPLHAVIISPDVSTTFILEKKYADKADEFFV